MSATRTRAATAKADADLWTVDDVADYFRVTHWTIRAWRNADATFPAPLDLPGRSLRWYREDIIEWALSLRGELP